MMRQSICMLAIVAGVLCYLSCYPAGSTETSSVAATAFCLSADDIAGWTPEGACAEFNQEQLYDLIDGSANVHETHGMVRGIVQRMNHADGRSITAYAFDFGSLSNAAAMYAEKKGDALQILSLSAYDNANAVLDIQGAYYMVYAHFGQHYFDLTLDGFDADSEAVQVAEQFLAYYHDSAKQ